MAGSGRHRPAAIALGALAGSNVVANRLLPASAYVPWNLGLAAMLLGLSRRSEMGWADVGLAPADASRGLPALLRPARLPTWVSDLVSAGLFGLWHVLPARDMAAANEGARALQARIGPAGTRALAVASTTLAGLALTGLRRAGGHLAAPALAHWATNALGLVAARIAVRRS